MIGQLRDISLSLDGVDLKSDIYNFTLSGLFDNNFEHFESDIYSNGGFVSGSKVHSKQLVLNGYVKTSNPSDIMYINRLLGSNSKKTLRVQVEGIGSLSIDVMPSNFITDDIGKKSCQLIAHDPYIYGDEIELNITSYHSGVSFPLSFPFKFGTSTKIENFLNNEGTEKSYPIIEVKGPCINPSVANITTNERLTFNGLELFAGDILVIDNRPRTRSIKINGTNRIDLKNGSWISCMSGLNEFNFNKISSTDESLCKVKLQSRWL